MRTESGAPRAGLLARYRLLVGAVALVTVLVAAPLGASRSGAEPPWRDAERAARDLAEAQLRLLDARDGLVEAENRLVALEDELDAVDQETVVLATELQAVREFARDLAVEAYMSGGTLTDALYLLDATTANDFAYRSTLITESAGAVARSTDSYVELRSRADDDAVALSDEMDRMDRRIELARAEIAQAELALADAEWVMTIAEIHRAADELMVRWGRTEPTEEQWDELRFCESGRDYEINTGNGFFGAYQFNLTTWVDMGGSGLPSDAPPEEQDARARYLYALRGSGHEVGGPWPLCGRFLPAD